VLFLRPDGTVKATLKIADGTGGLGPLSNADSFGRSAAPLGDLDGDGVTDLAVGAHHDDTGGLDRGAVYVLFLRPDGTVRETRKLADRTGGFGALSNSDLLGTSVTALGDLDGDGVTELAVGAGGDDTGGDGRGAVYVLSLSPLPILAVEAVEADRPEGDAGATALTFRVTRSGDTAAAVAVDWAVSGDVDAADFGGALPSGTVHFAAGQTEATVTLLVSGDTTVELDESLTLTLSNPSPDAKITAPAAHGTVRNNDSASLSVNNPSVEEDAGRMTFAVSLSHAVDADVQVAYTTAYGSATALDYTQTSGVLTIPAGRTSATLTIELIADQQFEPHESFTVALSDAQAGGRDVSIAVAEGTGTILSDDFIAVADVPDQEIAHTQDGTAVAPLAWQVGGYPVDYAARIVDPLVLEAYRLDRQHGLRSTGDYWFNFAGRNEKWLLGDEGWFYVTPDGGLYCGDGTAVAALDASYYDEPARLFDAAAPPDEVEAYLLDRILGLRFTGDDWFNHAGRNEKWLQSDRGWHYVTPDGALYRGDGTFAGALDPSYYTDPARLFEAEPPIDIVEAYLLDRILGLRFTGDDWFNYAGRNEKWLLSDEGWYYVTPDGGLYRGDGTSVATLDASYYDEPARLHEAANPLADPSGGTAEFTWAPEGVTLTVKPASGFRGALAVELSATAGPQGISETVWVSVVDHPPGLDALTDVEIDSAGKAQFDLAAFDPDGEAVTYTAELLTPDPAAVEAYRLDRRLDVQFTGNDWRNFYGLGEKWLQSDRGWLIVLPNGEVHTATRTPSESTRLVTLDTTYHTDLAKLYDATFPPLFRAAALNEALGVRFTGNYWENIYGLREKWVQSDRGWLIILPNGEVHTATPKPSAATRLETLDPSYYHTPARLHDAPDVLGDPGGSTVVVSSSRVTVDPDDGFIGALALRVTARSGVHSVEKVVLIRVVAPLDPQAVAAAFAAGAMG
jgi:hypothetical protein